MTTPPTGSRTYQRAGRPCCVARLPRDSDHAARSLFRPGAACWYARERGILLIAGIERTIARRHVLLINFPAECERVCSFEEIGDLKARTNGLVVAPHPSIRPRARSAVLCSIATPRSSMSTNSLDVRTRARLQSKCDRLGAQPRQAGGRQYGPPSARGAGGDVTVVDAEPDPNAVCTAIRAGRVTVHREPLGPIRAARLFSLIAWGGIQGRLGGAR